MAAPLKKPTGPEPDVQPPSIFGIKLPFRLTGGRNGAYYIHSVYYMSSTEEGLLAWLIGIDVGGTFTDFFAVDTESGAVRLFK